MTASEHAGLAERILSHIIDSVLLFVVAIILSILVVLIFWIARPLIVSFTGQYSVFGIGVLFFFIFWFAIPVFYFTYFICNGGQTLGKSVMKIKVVDKNGNHIGYLKAFLRYLIIQILSFFPLFLAFLLIVFDKEKQSLHDKIVGTYVVKENAANFDVKKAIGLVVLSTVLLSFVAVLFISILPVPQENSPENNAVEWMDLRIKGNSESLTGANVTIDKYYVGSILSWDCADNYSTCIVSFSRNKIQEQPYHTIYISNGNWCKEWILEAELFRKDSAYNIVIDSADGNNSNSQNCLAGWL